MSASNTPVAPSVIGRMFLKHYFNQLQTNFDLLHDLYHEEATVTHRSELGAEEEVTGPAAIQDLLERKGFRQARWVIWDLVTCQNSSQGGVVVTIVGNVLLPAPASRSTGGSGESSVKVFTQNWILNRVGEGRFSIRNDILIMLPVDPSAPAFVAEADAATAAAIRHEHSVGVSVKRAAAAVAAAPQPKKPAALEPKQAEKPKAPVAGPVVASAAAAETAPETSSTPATGSRAAPSGSPKSSNNSKRSGKHSANKPRSGKPGEAGKPAPRNQDNASAAAAAGSQQQQKQQPVRKSHWAARVGSKASVPPVASAGNPSPVPAQQLKQAQQQQQQQQEGQSQKPAPQKPQQAEQAQQKKPQDAQQGQQGGNRAPRKPRVEVVFEHSVHVAGLPPLAGAKMEQRVEDLKKLFAQFGRVVQVHSPKPNFAFVEFSDVASRQSAVNSTQETPLSFRGNEIVVTERQKPKARAHGSGPNRSRAGQRNSPRNQAAAAAASAQGSAPRKSQEQQQQQQRAHAGRPARQQRRVVQTAE